MRPSGLRAGRRNKRIVIEARTVAHDGYGGAVETWTQFAHPWAAVYYGSGSEQRAAAQENGSQAASFEVLRNSKTVALSIAEYRILHDGGVWDITALVPIGFNEGVRITATRAAQ